jgi:hypothetical protein
VTATTPEEPAEQPRSGLAESLLDNLPVWTVIAAAIAFLYLVWATIEILSRYVGVLPKVGP